MQFENFTKKKKSKAVTLVHPPRQESIGSTQPRTRMKIYTALAHIHEVHLLHPFALLCAVQSTPKQRLQKAVIGTDPAGLCGMSTAIHCKPQEAI